MAPSASIDLYIATFNCGRAVLDVETFASTLFTDHKSRHATPDLIFLALQEVAPIAQSYLGGALLAPYFAPFLQAINEAASSPDVFRHLITHNIGMTAIMMFVKTELSPAVQWLQTGEVGVGWSETGNKGAAAARLGWKSDSMPDIVPLTFVAAHLAPMEDQCQRRNHDWENIVRRLAFKAPNSNTASLSKVTPSAASEDQLPLLGGSPDSIPSPPSTTPMFIPKSPVFFAGDLNYRTGDTKPSPETNTPSTYPQPRHDASDPAHFSHLLPRDQLTRERKAGHTLHYLSEAPISFAPTYKFSEKQQESTTRIQYLSQEEPPIYHWATHRLPSWCDRVLYSYTLEGSSALTVHSYRALSIQPTSDHRPVALSMLLDLDKAAEATKSQVMPFEMDSTWEARRFTARRAEVAVGVLAYLASTWEGNALVGGSLVGMVGGWLVLSSLFGGGY